MCSVDHVWQIAPRCHGGRVSNYMLELEGFDRIVNWHSHRLSDRFVQHLQSELERWLRTLTLVIELL